ncbi:hypothetical protein AJ78_05040 [Emergomyces pasteurianus Ep9510]|uniref:BSD domain-containing protein n=1 Tax=Emergomyces pasteurianus Ep9510 TaxID=1447872 RepID=A0A1J9Q366_9EURO|nr:hypothetical protein AJ78_05040 [Emergomyces pasteurianus Ep9510]
MDVAYDHIQEEIFTSHDTTNNQENNSSIQEAGSSNGSAQSSQRPNLDLGAEFQETFRAFSSNPWGARLGGLWGTVRKQGETYYQGARQEYEAASEEAIKGFTDLTASIVGRTRALSLGGALKSEDGSDETKEQGKDKENKNEDDSGTPTTSNANKGHHDDEADGEGIISRFRSEAAKRLKDIEKAEDAADEALLRFGTNIRNFLRDAVSIAPPEGTDHNEKVLFESKDLDGKRVIHTTRFEAQLHAVHSNLDRLSQDPVSDEWPSWKSEFKVDNKTSEIASDLETYPELRRAMEALVPEKVEYADFWCRYYFLRLVIESDERKRKEMLKGASAADDEEIAWDEDSDSESDSPATPQVSSDKTAVAGPAPTSPASMSASRLSSGNDTLKAAESRRSNDQQSQTGSDASYDLVSGAPSRAPNSPRESEKRAPTSSSASKTDDSDEEDWE